ncbi:MAG: hypothetical protein K0S32_46 [Bacteroidetes bacterium]|jgi:hypothetical protein|nr:hypothetical protein [Bacteroidota bacterium]
MKLKGLNIKAFFVALLCAVFVVNATHELFHTLNEHTSELHTGCDAEDEADDCHRYIVHHIKSEHCDGDHDHFSKTEEKCFKCEFFKEQQSYFFEEKSCSSEPASNINDIINVERDHVNNNQFCTYLRGPPVVA